MRSGSRDDANRRAGQGDPSSNPCAASYGRVSKAEPLIATPLVCDPQTRDGRRRGTALSWTKASFHLV